MKTKFDHYLLLALAQIIEHSTYLAKLQRGVAYVR